MLGTSYQSWQKSTDSTLVGQNAVFMSASEYARVKNISRQFYFKLKCSGCSYFSTDYQRRFRERVGRKTIAETLDYKGSRDFKYTDVDLNPTFILVQVLERGQYFVSLEESLGERAVYVVLVRENSIRCRRDPRATFCRC